MTNAPAKIDRSALMRNAWNLYRTIFGGAKGRNIFRAALRQAWRDAARAVYIVARDAKRTAEQKAAHIALVTLEAKDRWTPADYEQAATLRQQVAA